MNKFYIVLSSQQSNGLAAITRHETYSLAHEMAKRKAQQFPDVTFFVAEAMTAVLCPPSEVLSYHLASSVREVA